MAKNNSYGIRDAAREGWRAIRKNIMSIVVAFLSVVTLAMFIGLFLALIVFVIFLQFNELTTLAVALATIGIITGIVLLIAFQAFINNVTSLAFADGLHGRKSDVGKLLKNGFKAILRVAATYMNVLLVIIAPLLAVGILFALLSVGGLEGSKLVIAIAGFVAWFCWAVIAGFRYALAPLVSLFEPKVSPRDALARSYQLMRNGGFWFLIKGLLVLMALNILFSVMTGGSNFVGPDTTQRAAFSLWYFIVNIISLAVSIVAQAAFVAFYLNRTKSHSKQFSL